MFFGSVPFSSGAFADSGLESTNVTVPVTGQSLTLTLDNDYIVQKIHHVNGNSLTSTLNSVIPNLAPTIAGTSLT